MSKPCLICGRDTNDLVCVICKLDPTKNAQVREIIQNKGPKAVTEKESDDMSIKKECITDECKSPAQKDGLCYRCFKKEHGKSPYSEAPKVKKDNKKRKYTKRTPEATRGAPDNARALKNLKDYEEAELSLARNTAMVKRLAGGTGKFSALSDLLKDKMQNVKKAVQELEALI